MEKSSLLALVLSLFTLFTFNLTAQNLENNESFLLEQIKTLESKKKELVEEFKNTKEVRDEALTKAASILLEKNQEIYSIPYRMAELEEDGVTPAKFAVRGRQDVYKQIKEYVIGECQKEIENNTSLEAKIKEVQNSYDNLESSTAKTVSSANRNVTVKYGNYSGKDIGWKLYITVNTSDVHNFHTTAFLSYKDLTDETPPTFADNEYTYFCDNVEYYDRLFKTGKSPLVFEVTYNSNFDNFGYFSKKDYIADTYEYNTKFESLVFYNKDKDPDYKKELYMDEYSIKKEKESAYDIARIFDYYDHIEEEVSEKIYELCCDKLKEDPTTPVALPVGTNGCGGVNSRYVLFGYWPQSVKAKNVSISRAKEKEINGLTCYEGSDEHYYVRVIASPFDDDYEFNNETPLKRGKEYYFKVEPIKWRILSDKFQKGTLLLAENILDAKCFDDNWNNYVKSDIRQYLNEDFLNKAFTKEAIEKINTVTVDNSADSTADSDKKLDKAGYSRDNTKDKVFLLSLNEVTRADLGFGEYKENDKAREKKNTDYARAVGSLDGFEHTSWWWVRSPIYTRSDSARNISVNGSAFENSLVNLDQGGVVPALVITY